ncbi:MULTISPECIES: VirD4-like conjugal transfer protein, CD1115 family [unclassified Oscillibacter]|uniref:VirD4-like conjugal transfer protein, CD1115 family n=1 Tax=unclassified Oscillibacter TaxID=2629304 RepID=UPI0003ADC93E|nr:MULTISPECIES: type IV secretory system conjugative DNA transfer family protein [unclassified Oscillibacter]ERK56689.1 TraG/TraD family protein [Oscillibacter sp. KLE 1728]ERK66347.1 TraG/TraD family protein [Oscillibacter sp. KLE 1745]
MRQNDFRSAAPVWAALSPLILWLAAIAAYAYEDGMNLFQWMGRFSQVLERPFSIDWTPYTLKCMLVGLLLYGCGIALYYSSRENRRPGEEYGSAKWGNPKELNRKYMDHQHKDANIILTQRVRLGMDGYITQRNMNILVIGGSGSGKTRYFCKPGLYSANCSYLVTDPKGELLRAAGGLLLSLGYEVRVFNLIDPEQSDCYNPFVYVREEKDVLSLIDNLIKNTTPRNASSNDPFWEKAEVALDSALMLYLIHEAPQDEQNFETMLYMMNFADVREEDEQYRSPLDMLFRALEEEQPAHVAVKQYKVFKQAAGKTAKSILVTAAVRLAAFNIPQYAAMTSMDEMDFGSLGERKRAIFCVIPVNDSSMNYLVGMLYTQCFQELYRRADLKYNGRLPIPVRVLQDEWANVAQPESYPKILATCRSYNIGLNIIVQNVQQIKALYEKEHESIIGNCDTLLFLGGGNEPASLEFIVKLLGRETLATRTRGLTKGRNGSSTTNYQQTGRDLMTIDEVRKLDTNKAILFIRGENPVIDRKYNLKRHPNIKLTSDGKAKPYIHKPQGAPDYALPDLPYAFKSLDDYEFIDMEENEHEQTEEKQHDEA